MSEFAGKTVLISGAAKGQGKAVALAFADEGANIIGLDLAAPLSYPAYSQASSSDLEDLAAEVRSRGGQAVVGTADVRSQEEVDRVVSKGVEEFGGVDIVFANAGITAYGSSRELTEDRWRAVIDVNLTGAWHLSKAAIPSMIAQESGVIIYNSSIAGLRGLGRMPHYAASKHGLVGLAKSQAIELAPFGIRVLTLHPTGVDTPMNDGLAQMEGKTPTEIAEASASNLLPVPWIETEDVVAAVKYMAGRSGRYLTGSGLVLDAGLLAR